MAIFKPEVTSNSNFTSFTGVCELGITGFTDKSQDFDWADLFIEILVKQKGSDYDRTIQIKGELSRENGKITGGSILKRMYHVFDQLGCKAGITLDGNWEDQTQLDRTETDLGSNFKFSWAGTDSTWDSLT